MKYCFAALCGIVFLLTGCRSDIYYQERAVERARTYLLKNARDLTPEELAYVRFNDPVLLHGDVLVSSAGTLSTDLHQICVTWKIPTKKELYMVYGVSTGRMAFWEPQRLIRRHSFNQGIPWQQAVSNAGKYAVDNLYEMLSVEEMNQVRFANPWLMQTNFDLNLETIAMTEPQKKKKVKKDPKKKQYSLVWKFNGKSLVFAGYNPPWKGGWSILFASFVSDDELKKATVKVITSPDDLQSVIINDEKDDNEMKAKKSVPETNVKEK